MLRRKTRFNIGQRQIIIKKNYTWLLWLFIIIFSIGFIVLATVYPADPYYHHRDRERSKQIIRNGVNDCTVGEEYESALGLCAPKTNIPIPVLPELYDLSTDICKSFYQHTCGNWIRNHTNEDRSFTYVYRKNKKRIYDIISNPNSGPVYTFFRSCLDTLVHGKHHFWDMDEQRYLLEQTVERLQSYGDIPVILARLARHGYTTPFTVSIESHPTRPEMIPLITKNDFYNIEEQFLTIEEYVLIEDMIEQMNIWYLPSFTANNYVEYVKNEFPDDIHTFKMFNHSIFWKQYFIELGGSNLEHDLLLNEKVWIPKADYVYIQHMLSNLEMFTLQQWKIYCKYSVIYGTNQFMPVLPQDSYFRKHDITHHTARHTEHQLGKRVQDDVQEHHCVTLTNVMLPGMMANLYMHNYMPNHEEIRTKVTTIVENVRDSYANLIQETSWMTEETKEKAVEKIRNIVVRAVHPNIWETEPFQRQLTMDKYIHNLNLIRKYRVDRNLQLWSLYKESNPRDAIQRFGAPLTTVNAYYSPVTNTITVFAGIITEPFYSDHFSDVTLYATLGMIAGHELSHAMDNNGRLFDKDGSLVDWWTENDVSEFMKRTTCIVNEYGPPQGCENAHYGEQTLGEDIADITGIQLAFRSYFSNSDDDEEEKRWFFTIFAQLWAESFDQRHLCDRVNEDVHAIALFRVDKTLRQLTEFRKAFRCNANDDMVNNKACKIYG